MYTARQALCALLVDDCVDWSVFTTADWNTFLAIAQADGLLPLLHRRLDAQGWPPHMPPDLRRTIQLGSYNAVAHTGLIYDELQRVLAALADATTVVMLKGAALGPTLYPAPALRPLNDIDLLVPEQDLAAATAALHRLGYREVPELTPGINALVEYHTRMQGGPNDQVIVELHWRLVAGAADWRSPSQEWFWRQIEPWQPRTLAIPAQAVWQLTPTAHLLYLAAHLVLQHGSAQARLIWLYDLHLLITQQDGRIHWSAAIEQARQFHWAGALHTALLAAQRAFGTPLSEQALAALSSTTNRSAQAFAQRKASAAPTPTISEWFKLQALEPRARLRFVGSLLCPSPSYMRWRYQPRPVAIWPLLYPYHWLRIAHAGLQIAGHFVRQRRIRTLQE